MNVIKLTAPAYWACYLINGDASGMEESEIAECDAWLESVGLGGPVGCEEEGFKHWHDARMFARYAADCALYTFIGARIARSHVG